MKLIEGKLSCARICKVIATWSSLASMMTKRFLNLCRVKRRSSKCEINRTLVESRTRGSLHDVLSSCRCKSTSRWSWRSVTSIDTMPNSNAVQTKHSSTKNAARGKLSNRRSDNTLTNCLHRLTNRKIDANSARWWLMKRESWIIKTFKDTRTWIHRRVMEAS